MLRIIVPVLIGCVLGFTGTVFVAGRMSFDNDAIGDRVVVTTGSSGAARAAIGKRSEASADHYTDAYRTAEQFTDADAVEDRLVELFSEPYSTARDAEIAALFERLAAFDLGRAIRIAETPGFDVQLVAGVLRNLAEQDPAAAIQALAAIGNPALQIDLAVVVLAALGNNAANLDLIANSLPEYQRVNLQIEALGQLAEEDPDGALRVALNLSDTGVRNAAAQRVGIEWAHQDPIRAFEITNDLPNELRDGYRDAVAVEWARLDSDGFLSYADTQPALDELLVGLMHTIGVAPARTHEVGSTHPSLRVVGNFGPKYTVEYTSFTNAAALDPERYSAMVDSMPDGQKKRQLTLAIAEVYGRTRPRDGIAWARARNDPDAEALVVQQSYVLGYDVAFPLMVEFNERYHDPGLLQSIGGVQGQFLAGAANRDELATRLLNEPDQESASIVLNQFMRQWAQTDAEGAFEWMLASGSDINPNLVSAIAGRLAARDATRAAAYIERIPEDFKQAWLAQVAPAYASQDPAGAAIWMTQFQGEPGYDEVFQRVALQMSRTDPAGAAAMLPSAPADVQQSLAGTVASGLARENITGAARWALGLRDEAARASAVSQVASGWAYRDPRAAQRWAVGLPRGELRDRALSSVLARLSSNRFYEAIDPKLLEAFDSDSVREQQVGRLVGAIAPEDPDLAQSMLDKWISDPVLRSQMGQAIEKSRKIARRQ